MRLPWLSCLLLLASSLGTARAQLGIYGTFDTTHVSDKNNNASTWFYGPQVGAYYDFLHLGPISAGLDLRGNFLWGDNQRYRSGLLGIRLAVKPPLLPVKPYVQGSIGAGGARSSGASVLPGLTYSNKFQYEVLGGVDLTVFPHVDLRVVELGVGSMSGVGGGSSVPNSHLFSASSGLVLRLP